MSNMNMLLAMLILAMFMAGVTGPVYAGTPVEFKGNLVVPLCTINNNTPVTVSFGDVDIQTMPVKSERYHSKDFSLSIFCPYSLGTPMLTVTSVSAFSPGRGGIGTSKIKEGLVLMLRQRGGTRALSLGTPNDVTSSITGTSSTFTLTLNAALVQLYGMDKLTPGPFTATANLQLQYQ